MKGNDNYRPMERSSFRRVKAERRRRTGVYASLGIMGLALFWTVRPGRPERPVRGLRSAPAPAPAGGLLCRAGV